MRVLGEFVRHYHAFKQRYEMLLLCRSQDGQRSLAGGSCQLDELGGMTFTVLGKSDADLTLIVGMRLKLYEAEYFQA